MKKIFKKYFALFKKADHRIHGRRRNSKGQSLVEVAIAFPLLIMLFSGMVEFGFMLNTYLSLLDATRQTARFYANFNPFSLDTSTDPDTVVDDMGFYTGAAGTVIDILDPPTDPNARSIVFNPAEDDIIISVIKVSVSDSTHAITAIERFPAGQPEPYYQLFKNHPSAYADDARIESLMTVNGTVPVRTGILIVEVYYGYEGILKLPWVEAFMDTIMLHADTVMPLVSAKPPRTP
ncbi:MAG: pilus assembly protein [Chloroflexi bacterium]|nr:pilus assembly protein [Chloroflexota bacterium]